MRPERPPTFDPNDERYWDADDLQKELERVFTICHGCRMCVGYCPSFPAMFKAVDAYEEAGEGEIEVFKIADYEEVNDLCFQCKLCYIKCPYTPDDEHDFALDFPRLMLRHKAQRARRDGISLQDRALGEPQLLGKLGSGLMAPVANLVTTNRLLRKVQEKAVGISAEFNLPPFAGQTLRTWFDRHTPAEGAGDKGEVALFSTCTTDYNMPSSGVAAVEVLEHNGIAVHYPSEQTCCGMPNLDGGAIDAAVAKAKKNVATLLPLVERGIPVVVPGPTCSYVLKKEYPDLLGTAEARKVAENTFDLMEYLRKLWREKVLSREFPRPLGKIAYHAACHLRAQKIGAPGRILLSKVPDTEITVIEECSAVDGTWGMKAQHYEDGRKYARKLIEGVSEGGYDGVASDCPLSGQRIAKELGTDCYHPVELVHRAYGLGERGPASPAVSAGKATAALPRDAG